MHRLCALHYPERTKFSLMRVKVSFRFNRPFYQMDLQGLEPEVVKVNRCNIKAVSAFS
jgi:hypothetical protein